MVQLPSREELNHLAPPVRTCKGAGINFQGKKQMYSSETGSLWLKVSFTFPIAARNGAAASI